MSGMSPVYRLTDDVLSVIFSKLCQDIHLASDQHWDWIQVTHVCRKWRQCALETPSLWANIFSSQFSSPTRTRVFLERSRNASLSLTLNYLSFDNIRLCLEDIHRIRSVNITGKFGLYRWSSIPVFLGKRAPRLTSVTLNNISYEEYTANLQPWFLEADENGSSLTSIRLTGFSLTWTSPALRNLTTLSLQKIVDSTKFPKVSELVDILINSPGLEIFELMDVGVINNAIAPATVAQLPHLKTFNLERIKYNIVAKLTHVLRIPDGSRFRVSCFDYPFHSPELLFPSFLADDHTSKDLSIHFNPSNVSIVLHGEHRKDKIKLDLYQRHDSDDVVMFKSLITTVGDNTWMRIKKLYIFSGLHEIDGMTTELWISFLKFLPNLEFLELHNSNYGMESRIGSGEKLIRALSQTEISSTFIFSMLCPKLTYLGIDCLDFRGEDGNFCEEIKFFLEMRGRGGVGLRRIDIWHATGANHDQFSELSEFVDECGFFYEGIGGIPLEFRKGPSKSLIERLLSRAGVSLD